MVSAPARSPMTASTTVISMRVMPCADRRRTSGLRLGVPAVDVVVGPFLLVGTERDHAEVGLRGHALAALHDERRAPRVLQVLLVRVLEQVLELVRALALVVRDPAGIGALVLLEHEERGLDPRLAERAHDLRADEHAHDEPDDREHDHDLDEGHAALNAPRESSVAFLHIRHPYIVGFMSMIGPRIEKTMNATVPPMNTIMSGSSSAVSRLSLVSVS